ncbi:hypothetical protein [Metabacillus halosaccharovorans]|uniref:hypothetical protein n=1 Tax=Metabacillus halosaccharovorans TaxID=930124 RepID=UPI00203ED583|nr:hypothetical protein [Metabacillus halosaccharovorans]MCM3441412.1 hypothetical protein [Metabacillus halosaccharovorans]
MTNTKRILSFIVICFFVIVVFGSSSAFAATIEIPVPQKNDGLNGPVEAKEMNTFLDGVTKDFNINAPLVTVLISAILTIMFIFGIIRMIYALITKTGMVLKGSTGVLIGIPVFFVILRLFFILAFTVNKSQAALLVTDFLNLLIHVSYLLAIGMVLIGLAMKLFHRFLEHPEYGRWSKRLYIGAVSLTILTAIMPIVFESI